MLNILRLKNIPIWEQLQIEEALLRIDDRNFFILNEGSPKAIIMGISGKEEELIHPKAHEDNIPVFRRFSGGGTVIVDEDTVFATWICQKEFLPCPPFPERILHWSAEFYQKALDIPGFLLQENDYAINHLKCGGNAQYLRKDRWLHHTSFLWDFQDINMDYLLHPKKVPKYRQDRSHLDFLCRLKTYHPSKTDLLKNFLKNAEKSYLIEEIYIESILPLLTIHHRKSLEKLHPNTDKDFLKIKQH